MTQRYPVPVLDQTYLAESRIEGVGVYANHRIGGNQVIAEIPAIIAMPHDGNVAPEINDYAFDWDGWIIVPGGCIAFLNHSDTPNAEVTFREDENGRTWIILTSTEVLFPHTEVTIDYGPDYWEARS